MRIVKGEWRGRHISFSHLPSYVRPTSNYAKEGVFNILEHNFGIEGKKILELFAGTGSIGVEFLSMQASHLSMVESSAYMCGVIKKWMQDLQVPSESVSIYQQDALQFLKQTTQSGFDFIFADPPFNKNYAPQILRLIREKSLLCPQGIFIYECSSHTPTQELCIDDWTYMRIASYGDTKFYFYQYMPTETEL